MRIAEGDMPESPRPSRAKSYTHWRDIDFVSSCGRCVMKIQFLGRTFATAICAALIASLVHPARPRGLGLESSGAAQNADDIAIKPFRIHISDAVLSDLKQRLERTRFPDEIDGSGWTYGTNLPYLKDLVTYWRTKFDWRLQEARLNKLPQFTTKIDGVSIHFVHQRSARADAIPLVFIHGWPGSFFEVTKIIGPLTNPGGNGGRPEDSFHVVAISLPGYGFSGKPTQPGYGTARVANIIAQLMARLGYAKYGAQGGDWGGPIVRQLGLVDSSHIIGLHSNLCTAGPPAGSATPTDGVTPVELRRINEARTRNATETAYGQIQATKPQTLGYALNDSPAGLAAWIVEKFRAWSDSDGDVEKRFTKDELLTNIMIYWVSQSATSSMRLYYENRIAPVPSGRIEVPYACAHFPKEPFGTTPRRWLEAQYNLVRYTEMPRGGHFAALEEPALLVEDVRAFFRDRR
jgi:pimeloyl-ACP methyl ester carboxylesterase